VLVACTQEAPLFTELAAEDNPEAALGFVNIRERAGWSEQAAEAAPKIAALIAEAALDIAPSRSVELESGGVCLVYGKDERALEAAKQLAGRLDVTLLLDSPGEIVPPGVMDVPIFRGARQRLFRVRPDPRFVRRRAAVPGRRKARRLPAPRPERPSGGAEGAVRAGRHGRHLR
jgi:hypothetical protein